MVLHEIRYYSINRFFGLLTGLWPEKTGVHTYVQICLISVFFVSGILTQLGVFVTHEYDHWLCLRILTCLVPEAIYLLKYLIFVSSKEQMVQVLYSVQADWDNYTNKEEQLIIAKYARNGRLVTMLYTTVLCTFLIGFMLWPHVPRILDVVMPLNKSRECKLPILLEYYVDPDKYFNLILLHLNMRNILGASVLIATEATSVMIVQHICGLFALVSYRMHNAVEDTVLNFKEHFLIREKVKSVVQTHYRALSLVRLVNEYFSMHYVLLIVLGVISLSLNLYVFARSILYSGKSEELLVSCVLIISNVCYILSTGYMSQTLLNQSHDVFIQAYSTRWYSAPLPIQKFVLLFMQRSVNSSSLTSGGIIKGSFEMVSSCLNTAASFFMVLWSIS